MKRLVIFILAIIMVLGVVSCGSKKEAPDTTTPEVTTDATLTDTTGSDTSAPDSSSSDTTVSDTTVSDTTVADTTVADTTVSGTTAPTTTAPTTTAPTTTAPTTTAPTTTAPTTTAPVVTDPPVDETDPGIVLTEGQAYKLVLKQTNLSKYLYATHTMSGEKYFATTDRASSAPDFYAEKASGGYKFYTMISGTKSYIKAYLEDTSKRLKYDTADGTVWYYKADCNAYFTKINGEEYVLGTYSTFDTFCISQGSYMTPSNSGVTQFPASLLTMTEVNNLPSLGQVEIYDTPEEIVNALYALEPGQILSAGHIYTLTGVITEVKDPYSDQYKNVTVVITVAGMTNKPVTVYRVKGDGADTIKVGDTITVSGQLTNYSGTYEFTSGCTLDAVNPA